MHTRRLKVSSKRRNHVEQARLPLSPSTRRRRRTCPRKLQLHLRQAALPPAITDEKPDGPIILSVLLSQGWGWGRGVPVSPWGIRNRSKCWGLLIAIEVIDSSYSFTKILTIATIVSVTSIIFLPTLPKKVHFHLLLTNPPIPLPQASSPSHT